MTPPLHVTAKHSCNWRCCFSAPEELERKPSPDIEVIKKTTQIYKRTHHVPQMGSLDVQSKVIADMLTRQKEIK